MAKSQRDKDIEAKRLEREARIENRAKKVQVLENLFPVLDEQQMQARLGAVLLEKIKDSITGNTLGCIHIQVQIQKNNNNETILKVLKSVFEIIGKSHYQGQKRTQRLRLAIFVTESDRILPIF